jgi:hypothetical protein
VGDIVACTVVMLQNLCPLLIDDGNFGITDIVQ